MSTVRIRETQFESLYSKSKIEKSIFIIFFRALYYPVFSVAKLETLNGKIVVTETKLRVTRYK